MPIRNPFAKRPNGATEVHDENTRPGLTVLKDAHAGFERVDTVGSKASSTWSIRSAKGQDNGDYKLSVVNDSGVFIPPSPTEEKHEALWPRRPAPPTRTSMDTRSSVGDIEHFSISRESFDSYRRSFDVSAKSPVLVQDIPRQSLDSARFPRLPRTALRGPSIDLESPTLVEEGFEDVGLHDEQQKTQQQQHHHQDSQHHSKKRSFFSKFGDSQESNTNPLPGMSMSRFIPGRKRAPSGQGAELGSMERSKTAQSVEEQEMQ